MLHQVAEGIVFDDTIPFFEQTVEFQEFANTTIFYKNDYTDMSNLQPDDTCEWVQEHEGFRYTAKRVYLNVKHYTVKDHIFTVEKL